MRRILDALREILDVLYHLADLERRPRFAARAQQSEDTEGTIGMSTLLRMLPYDAVVLEIGAHKGEDSELFGLMFPEGKIFGFEASPELYCEGVRRVSGLANVSLFPLAVGSSFDFRMFHASSGASTGSGSLLAPTLHLDQHPEIFFTEEDKFCVPVVPLDTVIQKLELSKIDLLWMDVQGAEGEVIAGAMQTLNRVSWIYVEVAKIPVYEAQVPYELLRRQLYEHGFIPEKEFFPSDWHGEGNVLFRRSDL